MKISIKDTNPAIQPGFRNASKSHDLFYEECGNGVPLLLVAGLASDSLSWETVIPLLERDFRLIMPNNRGVGRTGLCDGMQVSINGMAQDCAALLESLGIEHCHVLGHSMGGFIALELARLHPQRVDSLILAATSYRSSRRNNRLFREIAEDRLAGLSDERWLRRFFY